MTTADLEKLVRNKFPLEWIEARDFERLLFERATWIPLVVQKKDLRRGRFGTPGFRDGYRDIDSIVVPLDLQADFQEIDWQSVSRHNSDAEGELGKENWGQSTYLDWRNLWEALNRLDSVKIC